MKYREFHRKIEKNGWVYSHAEGSHYFYTKNGKLSAPIPFHGAKEMYEPLRKSIEKQLGMR